MKLISGFKALKTGEIWENPIWACAVFTVVLLFLLPFHRHQQGTDVQLKTREALEKGWQAYSQRTDPAQAQQALNFFREASRLSPSLKDPKNAWLITYFDIADRGDLPPQSLYEALDISNELAALSKGSSLAIVQSFIVLAQKSTSPSEKQFALGWAENILKSRLRAGIPMSAHHLYLQGRLKLLRAQTLSEPHLAEEAIDLFEAAHAKEPRRLRNIFWSSMAYRQTGQVSLANEKLRELLQVRDFEEDPPEAQWIYSKANECLESQRECLAL